MAVTTFDVDTTKWDATTLTWDGGTAQVVGATISIVKPYNTGATASKVKVEPVDVSG
jgi:hypothetical protein